MIASDEETAMVMLFLMQPMPEKPIIVMAGDKRFGGFRSREHAVWVMRQIGIDDYKIGN